MIDTRIQIGRKGSRMARRYRIGNDKVWVCESHVLAMSNNIVSV